MKIKNIIEGWSNVIAEDEQVEIEATRRLTICATCPKKIQMLGLDVCGLCHCPLMAKARSLQEKCPLGSW